VIEAAMQAFWRDGYEGVSTERLEAVTGLKRGSLYNAFRDKRSLFLATLERYAEAEMGAAVAAVAKGGWPALVKRVADEATSNEPRRGCLICNSAVELSRDDPAVGEVVRAALERLRLALARWLSKAGSADADAAAERLLATYVGLRVLARAGYSAQALQQAAGAGTSPPFAAFGQAG